MAHAPLTSRMMLPLSVTTPFTPHRVAARGADLAGHVFAGHEDHFHRQGKRTSTSTVLVLSMMQMNWSATAATISRGSEGAAS